MWLDSLRRLLLGAPRKTTVRRRPRLGVEVLEDRAIPATFTVNSLADLANPPAGVTTLRSALTAAISDHNTNAKNPDIINFAVAGTITLTSALPAISNEVVSIQGLGSGATTITSSTGVPLLSVAPGATANISALTLAGAVGGSPGVTVGAGATLLVQNVVIENCVSASSGGAILNTGGNVTVSLSTFQNNFATVNGGGIANLGGTLSVTQSTFNSDNALDADGGAIYCVADAASNGGALTVLECTFVGNHATGGYGGAIELDVGANATVVASTFTQNSASLGGGAISVTNRPTIGPQISLKLSGSTLAGNKFLADSGGPGGSGLYVSTIGAVTKSVSVNDSIIAGNLVTLGTTSAVAASDVLGPVDPGSAFNLIGDGSQMTGLVADVHGNMIGTATNPINPKLGALASNGGPTQTLAPLPGSLAIDNGGPDSFADALISTDQRGNPRKVVQPDDILSVGGDGRDIGALEVALQTPTILTVNSIADANPPAGVLTLRQAIQAANGAVAVSSLPASQVQVGSSNFDEIRFSVTGTITLASVLPTINAPGVVALDGPGASSLMIQGDGLQDTMFSVAPGAFLSVAGLTLDGNHQKNHGIDVGANAVLDVQNAVIQNALTVYTGGAVFNQGGIVSLSSSSVLNCISPGDSGGGIDSIGGCLTVRQSVFANDIAIGNGGAIELRSSAAAGAGVLTILDSTLTNNSATGSNGGGALYLQPGTVTSVVDSTLVGNSAQGEGGAIDVVEATLNVSNSTLTANSDTNGAGGIFSHPGGNAITLRNTIVAGNFLIGQPGTPADLKGAFISTSANNLIGDGANATGISDGVNGNLIGTNAAPIDARLGQLANNGGPTQTIALLPGSPAIDRGGPDPNTDSLTTTDQRGNPRIVAQSFLTPIAGGDGRDIGAYELAAQTTPTVLTVNSLADANPPAGVLTLREALQAAAGTTPLGSLPAGHVHAGSSHWYQIQFSVTGTIVLGSALPTITSTNVVIQGPGAAALTVQGDGLSDTLLTLTPGTSANVSGLTLAGIPGGGNRGFLAGDGATLLLQNTVLQNLTIAGNGAGILSQGGNVSVVQSQFLNEFDTSLGAAIANLGGTLHVSQSNFSGGYAVQGGAIYSAANSAGGGGTLTVVSSTFVNNISQTNGGALNADLGAQVTVTDSTFTGNVAAGEGGAISVQGVATSLVLSDSTLFANQDGFPAGGGGLFVGSAATAVVNNTIVAGNSQSGGPISDIAGALDPHSAFNLIGDGSGLIGISNGFNGNQLGTDAAPIDPKLGPLANNGGPTQTLALLAGSPAIDAGNTTLAVGNTDQRSFSRLAGPSVDIGAVEYQYDLAASVTATLALAAGGNITYNLTVTNNGPDPVAVTLTDPLPTGTTFVSFTAPNGATVTVPAVGQAGTVTATTSSVASGASVSFTLVVLVPAATPSGAITNTATFGPTTDDTNAANNVAVSTTVVTGPSGTITPSHGYDMPTFAWSPVTGANHYYLVVVDATTGAAVISNPSVNGLTFTPSISQALTPGHNFTWYIGGYNAAGTLIGSFAAHTFALAPLPAPTGLTPTGVIAAATGYDRPIFNWSASSAADHYYLVVIDNSTGAVPIMVPNVSGTSYATTAAQALTPGHSFTTYLYAVSTNSQVYSLATQTFSLATLAAPTGLSPSGAIAAATGYDKPTFNWNASTGADHYYLVVIDNNTGAAPITVPNIGGTTYIATAAQALTPGHSFTTYLYAVSTDAKVYSLASKTFSLAALAVPTGLNPSGTLAAASGYDKPTFNWTASTGADHYFLVVSDNNTGAAPIVVPNISGTTYTATAAQALTPGHSFTTYLYAVSTNSQVYSLASKTFSLAALPAPTGLTPIGIVAAAAGYDKPTFSWTTSTGADHYYLVVIDNNSGAAPIVIPNITGTTYVTTAAQALTPGHSFTTYLYAVSADSKAYSLASKTFSLAMLAAPALISPIGTTATTTPTFQWSAVAGADHYYLVVVDDTTGLAVVNIPNLGAVTSIVSPTILIHGRRYTWYLLAVSTDAQASSFVASGGTFAIA